MGDCLTCSITQSFKFDSRSLLDVENTPGWCSGAEDERLGGTRLTRHAVRAAKVDGLMSSFEVG